MSKPIFTIGGNPMYYARLVKYKLEAGQRSVAEKLTREFDSASRKLSGFRGNVYFFDDSAGEYRALNYWDTKEDAERAHAQLYPILMEKLQSFTKKKPSFKFFEVFDACDDGELISSHIKI